MAILGCSGSIGRQTLDVCREHSDKIKVTALSVNVSTDKLVAAAREFCVDHVVVADPAHDEEIRSGSFQTVRLCPEQLPHMPNSQSLLYALAIRRLLG